MDVVKSIFTNKTKYTDRPLPDTPHANNKGKTSTSDSGVVVPRKCKTERSSSLNDSNCVNQQISNKLPLIPPNRTPTKISETLTRTNREASQANINDSSAGEFTIKCPCGGFFKCSPAANDGNNCTIKCACGRVFGYSSQLSPQEQCAATYDKNIFKVSKPSKIPNESKEVKPPGFKLPPPPEKIKLKTPIKNNSVTLPHNDKKEKPPPPKTPVKPIVSTSPGMDKTKQLEEVGGLKMTRTKEPGSYLVPGNFDSKQANSPPILEKSLQLEKCAEPGSYAVSINLQTDKNFEAANGGLNLEAATDKKPGYYQVKKPVPPNPPESQLFKKSPPPPPPAKASTPI